jgi:hypothetical protein
MGTDLPFGQMSLSATHPRAGTGCSPAGMQKRAFARTAGGVGHALGAPIAAALNDARRSERPALREALAVAKRRDALDVELAAFEQRLDGIPHVATADASAAVLSDVSGTTISEHELRRLRLALLLGLPLCGGLVLSLAFASTAAGSARRSTTRLKPHLVRNTFDSFRPDAIEGSSG